MVRDTGLESVVVFRFENAEAGELGWLPISFIEGC